jgi:hypothetical protein
MDPAFLAISIAVFIIMILFIPLKGAGSVSSGGALKIICYSGIWLLNWMMFFLVRTHLSGHCLIGLK